MYSVIYYDSSDCCGAEEEGEGWECGVHSGWETATTTDTFEEAEGIAMAFNEGYVEKVEKLL
jgi:hypothetical protein